MGDTCALHPAIPVLRIYDVALAKAFYVEFLGFTVDWEHRFAPDLPIYLQVSRSGVTLHLSEHHGDGTPGTAVYIAVENIGALLRELHAKHGRFSPPDPRSKEADIIDPFGNVLRFDGSRRSNAR